LCAAPGAPTPPHQPTARPPHPPLLLLACVDFFLDEPEIVLRIRCRHDPGPGRCARLPPPFLGAVYYCMPVLLSLGMRFTTLLETVLVDPEARDLPHEVELAKRIGVPVPRCARHCGLLVFRRPDRIAARPRRVRAAG